MIVTKFVKTFRFKFVFVIDGLFEIGKYIENKANSLIVNNHLIYRSPVTPQKGENFIIMLQKGLQNALQNIRDA